MKYKLALLLTVTMLIPTATTALAAETSTTATETTKTASEGNNRKRCLAADIRRGTGTGRRKQFRPG